MIYSFLQKKSLSLSEMNVQLYKRGRPGVNGRVLASPREDKGILSFIYFLK